MKQELLDTINNASRRCSYGMALLAGFMATLAQPPFFMTLLIIPAFSLLFLQTALAKHTKAAFWLGWWWGLGYFTTGLYWICISLYVEPEKFAWLTPFALFGLPSLLAIYTGLACALAKKLSTFYPPALFFILPVCFTLMEYLRGHLFTGFPWNLIGYIWTVSDITLQMVYLTGIYGLGFITVLLASAPALFLLSSRALVVNISALCLFLAMCNYGINRLEHNPTRYSAVKIRMVQPVIDQQMKMNADAFFALINQQIDVTLSRPLEGIDVVIWSEAAIPYYLESGSKLAMHIARILPEKTLLMTGALRREKEDVYNSFFIMDSLGRIQASYDKHHLVPFGEFIPFRNVVPLESIAGGHGDFSSGKGAATLMTDTIPAFSPLLCYEGIFPAEATDKTGKARWLLNVTNDTWFGVSSGPYQHFQMERVRAVENGLPLVRVASNGISGVIDAFGRVVKIIPLNQKGILDFYLPLSIL